MATKLKHLKVTNVDFVDEGANPDAYIKLFKRKDDAAGEPGAGANSSAGAGFFKRLSSGIAKMFGVAQEPVSAEQDVEKNSVGFDEAYGEMKNRRVCDEVWDVCYALNQSLCSILSDGELTGEATRTAMLESLEEFDAAAKNFVEQWSAGKTANVVLKNIPMDAESLALAKAAVAAINEQIEKHKPSGNDPVSTDDAAKNNGDEPEGDDTMKIDKSKMTPAELAFFESIEKRYGSDEGQTPPAAAPAVPAPDVAKSLTTPAAPAAPAAPAYAQLDPAVQAELDSLRKFREDSLDRELREVAKKYAIIGKKEDELFPVLKSMKAAGGTAYNDYLAVLDEAVNMANTSAAFSEVGKRGNGSAPDAWTRAEAKAVELMKSKNVTKAQALDEVLMNDHALRAECEKEG